VQGIPFFFFSGFVFNIRSFRALATIVSGCGVLFNAAITVHLFSLWHSFKWDADAAESEWESTSTFGGIDSVKLAWSLLFLYFFASALLSLVGLVSIVKVRNKIP
jgi:hypothetical protein